MSAIDRRNFLKSSAAGALASAAASKTVFAQTPDGASAASSPASGGGAAPRPPKVTRILAEFIVKTDYQDLPAAARKEGVRTLMNWVGVAVGGSHDETVNRAVSALTPFSGPPQANRRARKPREFSVPLLPVRHRRISGANIRKIYAIAVGGCVRF